MKFLFLAFSILPTSAFAAGENLLSCQSASFFLTKCVMNESQLGARASYQGSAGSSVDVDTNLTLHYAYPCTGHVMKVGAVSDQQSAEFVYGGSSLQLQGFGPFALKNFSPGEQGVTYKAAVNNECSLKITSMDRDLSAVSIQLLKEKIAGMKAVNQALKSVRDSSALFETLGSVLASLDSAGLIDILSSVREEAVSLRGNATSSDAKDAIDDAIDEIDAALNLNPAATPASQLQAMANQILSELRAQTNTLIASGVLAVQGRYNDGKSMLSFAAASTKQTYQPQLDAELNASSGH